MCIRDSSTSNETRPRERSDRGFFLPMVKKASSYRGAYRVPLFNLSVGLCVNVCVIFVIFADRESYTRVISTNLGFIEAGEFKLTRETFFLRMPSRVRRGRRAAVDFVVCFGWDGFSVFFFS